MNYNPAHVNIQQQQQYQSTINELKRLHKEKQRNLLNTISQLRKKVTKAEYQQKDNIRVKRIKQLEQELIEQQLVINIFQKSMSISQANQAKKTVIHKLNDPPKTRPTRMQLQMKMRDQASLIQKLKSKLLNLQKQKRSIIETGGGVISANVANNKDISMPGGIQSRDDLTFPNNIDSPSGVGGGKIDEVGLNLKLQEYQQNILKLNGQIQQLQIELSEKDILIEKVQTDIERKRQQNRRLIQAQSDAQEIYTKYDNLKSINSQLQDKISSNLAAEDQLQSLKEIKNNTIRSLNDKFKAANRKKLQLQERLRNIEFEDTQKLKKLQQKNRQLEEQIKKIGGENERLQRQVEQRDIQFKIQEEQLSQRQERINELQRIININMEESKAVQRDSKIRDEDLISQIDSISDQLEQQDADRQQIGNKTQQNNFKSWQSRISKTKKPENLLQSSAQFSEKQEQLQADHGQAMKDIKQYGSFRNI